MTILLIIYAIGILCTLAVIQSMGPEEGFVKELALLDGKRQFLKADLKLGVRVFRNFFLWPIFLPVFLRTRHKERTA